jgi:hypothetical protein
MASPLEVDEFPALLAAPFEQKRQGNVIGAEQSHFKAVDVRGVR